MKEREKSEKRERQKYKIYIFLYYVVCHRGNLGVHGIKNRFAAQINKKYFLFCCSYFTLLYQLYCF